MAASVETQRLISLSLGKIAQSRGQRGGINLHKNLLVATVLHKARTAYMMETYSYHQQQNLQRQREQVQQQQQQHLEQQKEEVVSTESTTEIASESNPVPHADVEMGQTAIATPVTCEEESRSTQSSAVSQPEDVTVTAQVESEGVALDKENHPPTEGSHEGYDATKTDSCNAPDHLAAATQLAQDAALSSDTITTSTKQQTSGSPTCNGVLKRRRDNPPAISLDECPASKKARVTNEGSSFSSLRVQSPCQFSPLNSDCSSDESDSESDNEVSMMHATDSPQITNLVSIFNSGFSGLCASNKQDNTFTPLSSLRPESPTPSLSRKLSEPSLMCSSEVGRLGSVPSAIVLSA